MRLKPSEGRFSVRDYSGTYSPAEPKWSHFRQTKWPGEKRDAVTASCSLSLPIVPLRENSVPLQKDCRVEVPIMWWRPSAAAAPENEETADLQHRGQLQVQTTGQPAWLPDSGRWNTVKVTPGTQLTTSDPIKAAQSSLLISTAITTSEDADSFQRTPDSSLESLHGIHQTV